MSHTPKGHWIRPPIPAGDDLTAIDIAIAAQLEALGPLWRIHSFAVKGNDLIVMFVSL